MTFFRPRYELKYLVSPATAFAIAGKLIGRCHLDENGSDGYYVNESLYFDSPDFDFFFHKIEGVKLRKKVRIRRYGNRGPWEKLFVEIKRRNGQYIEKARFTIEPHLLPSLFNTSHRELYAQNLKPLECQVYNELLSLARLFQLRPILFIRYIRRSFWAEGDERLRITFDSELGYDTVNHDCLRPLENINHILDGDQVIMEIKANGSVPFWVLELIQEYECKMIRFSKYCLGVQAAYGLGGRSFSYAKEQATLTFSG
jgi:SPX domain protein involved in polyphosphate accumulation